MRERADRKMASDHTSIGSAYRSESEKSFVRATAFGLALIMTHLLGIEPSEFNGLGIKVSIGDPKIIYGFLALIYGHYLSRAMIKGESGQTLYPLRTEFLRLREHIRVIKRSFYADRRNRGKTLTPGALKRSTRRLIKATNVVTFPYYLSVTVIVVVATMVMIHDLWNLGMLISNKYL